MTHRWLFKTEPGVYSWQQLERDGRTVWDGVKNALALKHLRAVAEGDEVLIYHTGDEKAAVGIAVATRGAYPDPKEKDARAIVVDLRAERALARPVTLAEMRKEPRLGNFDLLRLPRLSVMPVSAAHWSAILRLAGAGAPKR
jgi:predicted RNA-binding protein with PUA-like domain